MLYFQELLVSQRIKFFSAVLKLEAETTPKNEDRDKEIEMKWDGILGFTKASTFAIMWMNYKNSAV